MPIPFIIAGVALAAGAYGAKKGYDAKCDYDEAEKVNEAGKSIYDKASSALENTRKNTQASLEKLGKLKLSLYQAKLIPFVNSFKKIHNIDFQAKNITDEFNLVVDDKDMLAIETAALKMQEIALSGAVSLGAGGLAGLAAYGGVGALASASTGTAIAGLSGAAATNATLAWLGGGALSAGGFGMAGGAAVLGGIVAGPVLAIGGMMIASKAEEAKHNAYSNLNTAKKAAEEMQTAQLLTKAIEIRTLEIEKILNALDRIFAPLLNDLIILVMQSPKDWSGKIDYAKLHREDQIGIMLSAQLVKTIKNVLETPLLDQKGSLTKESAKILKDANNDLLKVKKQLS